ncbi:ABC transporter ATP-binding protein/permease [Paracoccus aestuariivivens]|uniref:ABC transporter ATP-binding protein/permease n=1 Tax=Paracoccus aestuariivivens TaxID=1820333 RepID=UPI001FE520D6|nr:SbmA/BacA-like family transporter [Paracoccus aestuariivivens]
MARIATSGPDRWSGLALFALVLMLGFGGVWLSVRMIAWNKAFYDALENLDAAAALRQIGVFFAIVAAMAASWLAADWLRKLLLIRWRARLTHVALEQWVGNRAFWSLRPGYSDQPIENPDQRIAEDCRKYVEQFLEFTIDLITSVVALFSYVAVLWTAASFALNLTVWGNEISVPRYMVWLAPLYVAASTLITHLLGRPLKRRYFQQEKVEADFRHALMRLRDNADQIAQSEGEAAERRRLAERFGAVARNWRGVMRAELVLGLFTRPYQQTVLRIPTFFALPAYFAGAVTLGGLMQLASAFSNVTTTLSWFVFEYSKLAQFVAVCERLDRMMQQTAIARPEPQGITRDVSPDGVLRVRGLHLATPDGKTLQPMPDVNLPRGATLLIDGASGRGKTTMLCAITGLWRWGRGHIQRPAGRFLLLPAGAPVMDDDLLAAISYPHPAETLGLPRVHAVLHRVCLSHRLVGENGVSGLSMGERQRVGLARAVLNRPDWLILDEATAALDPASEADLLQWLRQELPETSIIITAHRKPSGLVADQILRLDDDINQKDSA